MQNTILCIKWGDKYDDSYVEKLREQCEDNCSVPFNFYCLTDNPKNDCDILLPSTLDKHYDKNKGFFWAYRKIHMFREFFPGDKFLFLDLDVIIHQDLKYFFELPMDKPWIVRGWWNDILTVKRNYSKYKSTPLNSSVIRWDKHQMLPVFKHVMNHTDLIFFTYPSLDNYLNHHWYDPWAEDDAFLKGFPKGDIYSFYKGNIYPDDMVLNSLRENLKICLFNNSAQSEGKNYDEVKKLW